MKKQTVGYIVLGNGHPMQVLSRGEFTRSFGKKSARETRYPKAGTLWFCYGETAQLLASYGEARCAINRTMTYAGRNKLWNWVNRKYTIVRVERR